MGLNRAKDGKLLYHLTELKNLQSILNGGLQPRRQLEQSRMNFVDIADPEIILRRRNLELDSFVPFHFHPYSAFDAAVKHSHVNDTLLYICISRKFAQEHDFKILPKHPLAEENFTIYDYNEGLSKIDWDTMMEVGNYSKEAKNIKMAEALCSDIIYAHNFHSITVASTTDKNRVENILHANCIAFPPPYVDVQVEWFHV